MSTKSCLSDICQRPPAKSLHFIEEACIEVSLDLCTVCSHVFDLVKF